MIAGGAISSAADSEAITVFHRMVSANKIEIVETMLRVDPNAKIASRFLATPGYNSAIHPIIPPVSNGHRAMTALLMAYAGCKPYIPLEDYEKSMAAKYVITDLPLLYEN